MIDYADPGSPDAVHLAYRGATAGICGRSTGVLASDPGDYDCPECDAAYVGIMHPAPETLRGWKDRVTAGLDRKALPSDVADYVHGAVAASSDAEAEPPALTPVCAVRAYNPATREDVMCGQPLPCPEPEHGTPAGQFVQAAWRVDGVGDDGAWPTWATPADYQAAERRRADFERERNGNWPAPEAPAGPDTGGWISGSCA